MFHQAQEDGVGFRGEGYNALVAPQALIAQVEAEGGEENMRSLFHQFYRKLTAILRLAYDRARRLRVFCARSERMATSAESVPRAVASVVPGTRLLRELPLAAPILTP